MADNLDVSWLQADRTSDVLEVNTMDKGQPVLTTIKHKSISLLKGKYDWTTYYAMCATKQPSLSFMGKDQNTRG